MSEEKALPSEKNTAERPAPFAAMKNEVEFTSGMESASEQEQKKVKSILLEIESELNAYDRTTGLKKIAFSRNFHIRPDLLEKIRSISDIRIQRGIINYYIDSAVHIKTSYIANMMDVKKRENGLTAKEIARTCSITASLLSRGIKDGAILLPPASIAAFCDIVTGQSVAETFFGMPPKIMLPLNLAEVAYRLQITTDVQFEAAERIAEEHHIQNIGMTIDSVTMWERFVEYNTDHGFTEGSLGAVPLRHYETITLRKLQQVAESEKAESAAPQTGRGRRKTMPTPSGIALFGYRYNISPDYFLARDYVLHNHVFIPGRFFTHDINSDTQKCQEVIDPRIRRILGRLLCMRTDERMTVCGEIIAKTI